MSGPFDALTGREERGQQQPLALVGVLTHLDTSIDIGILPKYHYVYDVEVDIIEAFSTGNINIGHADDADAYVSALSATGSGVQSPTLGTGIGYDDEARKLKATVSGSQTQGKALIIVKFFRVPRVN